MTHSKTRPFATSIRPSMWIKSLPELMLFLGNQLPSVDWIQPENICMRMPVLLSLINFYTVQWCITTCYEPLLFLSRVFAVWFRSVVLCRHAIQKQNMRNTGQAFVGQTQSSKGCSELQMATLWCCISHDDGTESCWLPLKLAWVLALVATMEGGNLASVLNCTIVAL